MKPENLVRFGTDLYCFVWLIIVGSGRWDSVLSQSNSVTRRSLTAGNKNIMSFFLGGGRASNKYSISYFFSKQPQPSPAMPIAAAMDDTDTVSQMKIELPYFLLFCYVPPFLSLAVR